MMIGRKAFQTILLTFLFSFATLSNSLPLSTSSRWIVEEPKGNRVKLTCVNWAAHLQPMFAEGLEKKPLRYIAGQVALMGFNCVRLTWATYMYTRYSNLTVGKSLDQLGLKDASAGIAKNNPGFLNLTLVDAQKAVIDQLGAQKIMVLLDNHVSLPKWCCDLFDGNGFFGDQYFDPNEWLQGLTMVAKRYKGNPTVVAMSLRNELRGLRQNDNDWYQNIQAGVKAIHNENSDLLVIVSGLSFDTNLGFLKTRPLAVNLTNKLVYEAHWYSFSDFKLGWRFQTNKLCAAVTQKFINQCGFVVSGGNPIPLFLSEFGIDQTGTDVSDNRYLGCLLATIAERDTDWALWALQGSYMLRQGKVAPAEDYGLFDANWDPRVDSKMQQKLQLIGQMIQDPKSNDPTYYVMFHTQSGQCVQVGKDNIYATNCQNPSRWSHNGDGSPIQLTDGSGCLRVDGEGLPAVVSNDCSSQRSKWKTFSSSKLHLAAQDDQGKYLCLEWDSPSSTILTKKCLCLGDDYKDVLICMENPETQWFKLIPTNRK